MKRTEALAPLSRDHHHGLIVALRLRKGGPASPRDSWPDDIHSQRDALLRFAEGELLPHFLLEEELLFPLCLASSSEKVRAAANELMADHQAMRSLLGVLHNDGVSEKTIHSILPRFGRQLEAHIRKEERSFFPLVEEELLEGRLAIDVLTLATKHDAYENPPACST